MKAGAMRRTLMAAVVAGVLLAPAVRAETLQDAWARAAEQDRALAAVRSQAEAAQLDASAARAQRWPTLAVGGDYTWFDDAPAFDFSFTGLSITPPELFGGDDFAKGSATLSVPLFTGGRITSSIAAAEARGRGAGAQLRGAEQDVKLAVAEAYVDVLRARKALAVAASNVRTLEALVGDIGAMYERELVPRNELLAVQVALADARQNRLRAANGAEIAQAAYNRRLGEPLDRVAEIEEQVPEPDALPPDLPSLVQLAGERRTELAALDEQARAYGQLAKVERSRVLPQVGVSGGYHYLENQFLDDEEFAMAGVGFQWALFDGGQARKRAAAMERNRRASEEQRADAGSLVALQVRQAWLGVEETRQRVQVSADAVDQAEENLRIARERYGAGLGTQTQLLEAETLRVRALTNRDNATLDAALARLRLARAAGSL
ncbi:MAG: TolC family protein [Steroidobacteraceae bacterium]|nr:TolC family protein [Steroidobacteraceae bacterium]